MVSCSLYYTSPTSSFIKYTAYNLASVSSSLHLRLDNNHTFFINIYGAHHHIQKSFRLNCRHNQRSTRPQFNSISSEEYIIIIINSIMRRLESKPLSSPTWPTRVTESLLTANGWSRAGFNGALTITSRQITGGDGGGGGDGGDGPHRSKPIAGRLAGCNRTEPQHAVGLS